MILHGHVSEEIVLFAPTILRYEVLNGLAVAERMGRIDKEVTEKAVNALLKLDIAFLDPFSDYRRVLSLARSFNRSVYEAAYLSLAMKNKSEFVTGDKRLYNALSKHFKWVKWIG